MAERYVQPTLGEEAFHCPHCGVYANQRWAQPTMHIGNRDVLPAAWRGSYCAHCSNIVLWYGDQMWYPGGGNAPLPNPDLPGEIQQLYIEAREIAAKSPRGAAALLRLAVQMLTVDLCALLKKKPTGDLNKDIGTLVNHGLPSGVQPALDSVRVIGNNAVHPGQIEIEDNPQFVSALFGLVNFIAEKMLTEQKEIKAIYDLLPEGAKEQIAKRDGG